ncbi:MAG: hypothetical protein P1V81_05590 [Planctomycetota bacterium]|nr:hypothetical protein [Planctomycetota bacterium]
MPLLSFLAKTDWVASLKLAAMVIVAIAFLAVVVRALGARPSAMRKGAHMPLDDPRRADNSSADPTLQDQTRA